MMTRISSLWLVIGVAVLPLFFAMLSYFGGWWQPAGKVNNGALIVSDNDQIPLQQGEQLIANGRWQLIMLSPQCQSDCQAWMQHLNNIKTALGRDADRVEPRLANAAAGSGQSILLVDPLGNSVLSYQLEQSPRDILDDLKRLLKVSKIG